MASLSTAKGVAAARNLNDIGTSTTDQESASLPANLKSSIYAK